MGEHAPKLDLIDLIVDLILPTKCLGIQLLYKYYNILILNRLLNLTTLTNLSE